VQQGDRTSCLPASDLVFAGVQTFSYSPIAPYQVDPVEKRFHAVFRATVLGQRCRCVVGESRRIALFCYYRFWCIEKAVFFAVLRLSDRRDSEVRVAATAAPLPCFSQERFFNLPICSRVHPSISTFQRTCLVCLLSLKLKQTMKIVERQP